MQLLLISPKKLKKLQCDNHETDIYLYLFISLFLQQCDLDFLTDFLSCIFNEFSQDKIKETFTYIYLKINNCIYRSKN